MKTPILLIALLISISIFGQEPNKTDFLSEIKNYDISNLLTLEDFFIEDETFVIVRPQPLGFIGENFQRFYIRFISVIKNPSNPTEYFVYGKTKVENNICTFQGKLTIKKSEVYDANQDLALTNEHRSITSFHQSLKQGKVSGEYEFYQDPTQRGAGILKGEFSSNFFLTKKNDLEYDVLMWAADRFENNQFEGKWTSYRTGYSKACNWGDFRIPNCNGLDVGTGEFVPDGKYNDVGWENYQLALGQSSDDSVTVEARNKENDKWWLDE